MILKLVIAFFGLLVLGLAAFFIFGGVGNEPAPKLPKTNFDFGDAPDGAQGQFPSLLNSNGARTKKVDEVFLGQSVTIEEDSKQVNVDEADDGVKLDVNSCKQSTAYFFVRIKNPGEISGIAYLNLYADWNNNKKWGGADECAAEWVVQNLPIDLSGQKEEMAVYKAQFIGGKNVEKIWYRGAVTLNQRMSKTPTGEFASGEIEDWGPKEGDERYYNFYCLPDPLVISHGSKGNVKILPDFFSEPIFDIQFGKNYNPKDFKRRVTIQNKAFTFESSIKDVDPPKRSVPHFVDLRVSFGVNGKEAVLEKSCSVIVQHDELTIETPSRRTFSVPTLTPRIETESFPTSTPVQEEAHPMQKEGLPALQ